MRNTFVGTLTALAEENPKLWLLCGDLGFSVLEGFASRFPERFLNVGVAEQNMAGIAAGIALSGKTVFIYSIGNFPTLRCLEQIRNDICYHGADVKVVSVGAGYAYGSQGYTHHALEDVAVMSVLLGMEVFVPCDPVEVRAGTTLMAQSGKPSYLRLSRSGEPILHKAEPRDLRAPQVMRAGEGLVILASGPIVAACLSAAEMLSAEVGLSASVISVPCLKPFDEAEVRALTRGARLVVTVEEHILRGGLHASVAACLAAEATHAPLVGLGIPELPGKTSVAGSREWLLARVGLSPEGILEKLRTAVASVWEQRTPTSRRG
jgi:transketolase